ncbi:MAG: cytochrome C [Proteobacteria bacterium]|nr:cytochrome C [Pseudomonadota bacterium]
MSKLGCLFVVAYCLCSASWAGNPAPVGLALEIDNGTGVPLKVKAGQEFFINIIDIREHLKTDSDAGVAGLKNTRLLTGLNWDGMSFEEEFVDLANPDGSYTRRRFYTGAAWMKQPSTFTITPLDAKGSATARAVVITVGNDAARKIADSMFINRLRAIQWTHDCKSLENCATARSFEEEALIEVRNSRLPAEKLALSADTATLQVRWSLQPTAAVLIPVEQVSNPEYAYGYAIAIESLTPPSADGTYPPGATLTFRLNQLDGAGKRLHPPGSLPTYNEFRAARNGAGLQYYRGFDEPAAAYYRRKHRERMLMAQIIGPVQQLAPIRSIVQLEDFLGNNVTQTVGRPERDGIYSEFQLFPPSNDMFGGAFDPKHAGWDAPVSDQFSFHVPNNAVPGTYLVTVKGRRVYLGEDIPATRTIEIQVGTAQRTQPRLTATNCASCHNQGGALVLLLHANDNLAACNGCHAPLSVEPDNEASVRIHFIHSRSDRYSMPLSRCAACHQERTSIQRASKAACLSCHKSYPDSHVRRSGAVRSIYVGGQLESFQSCADGCHKNHIGSGF